ncbi:MAG: methyltransferase [Planctomycetes bacterium]|nr:methyltransferase [Planctomycetota bacterium]
MIRIRPDHLPTLRRFRRALEEWGYARACARLTDPEPAHMARHLARECASMERPPELAQENWTLVALFFLGQEQVRAEVELVLDPGLLEDLARVGLVDLAGGTVRSDRYMIVLLEDLPFIVSRLRHARTEEGSVAVYFGLDTVALVERTRAWDGVGSVLDLGCGGGIAGILAAIEGRARRVGGTDLSPEAVEVARANAAMYGVEYHCRHGDLYRPVAGERFDRILADPPAIPVPHQIGLAIHGTGGPTGDALVRRVVEGAVRHLEPGGELYAVTEVYSSSEDHALFPWLEGFARSETGRHVRVEFLGSRLLPEDYFLDLGRNLRYLPDWDPALEALAPGERVERHARSLGIRFGHLIGIQLRLLAGRPSTFEAVQTEAFARNGPEIHLDPGASQETCR